MILNKICTANREQPIGCIFNTLSNGKTMSTENSEEKIRITQLDSGDESVSLTDQNHVLMVDSNTTGSKKLTLPAILSKIISYIKSSPTEVLPDSTANQVLSTDENNNLVWKDAEHQVNADWNANSGMAKILNKPDLTQYATNSALNTAKNELQTDIDSKANKSEMTITEGTGDVTIQLKNGTSATVLTQHQTLPEQVQSDWNNTNSASPAFINNKPTALSDFTNDEGYIKADAIAGKAEKSEMSITEGTGTATIQLKTGTSATVLTQHQNISGKADKSDTYTKTEVNGLLDGKSDSDHNHDSRYYTETEVDTALNGKADKATTLAGYGITDAKIAGSVITLGNQTITPLTSQDITGKAEKSEMSITEGTGTATIQLKSGMSVNVLTQHQTLPEQVQSDWNNTNSASPAFINNKPTALSDFTNDEGFITNADISGKADKSDTYTKAQVDTALAAKADTSAIPTVPVQDVTVDGTSVVDQNGVAAITLPAAQVQANWNESDSTSKAFILNKPNIPTKTQKVTVSGTLSSGTLSFTVNEESFAVLDPGANTGAGTISINFVNASGRGTNDLFEAAFEIDLSVFSNRESLAINFSKNGTALDAAHVGNKPEDMTAVKILMGVIANDVLFLNETETSN